MHDAIAQHASAIAEICRRYGIRKLDVFGSAARSDDFDPARSDVDFLIEFAPSVRPDLRSFYGVKAELETLLGREVDLVESGAVNNPFVLAAIERQRQSVFNAA